MHAEHVHNVRAVQHLFCMLSKVQRDVVRTSPLVHRCPQLVQYEWPAAYLAILTVRVCKRDQAGVTTDKMAMF